MIRTKKIKKDARHRRIRARVKGTAKRPRLSVFKSNKHLFVQLIDDGMGKTLISVSDVKGLKKDSKKESAYQTGKLLAEKAIDKKIREAVFDRGGHKFHGIISEIAKGAREGGLTL